MAQFSKNLKTGKLVTNLVLPLKILILSETDQHTNELIHTLLKADCITHIIPFKSDMKTQLINALPNEYIGIIFFLQSGRDLIKARELRLLPATAYTPIIFVVSKSADEELVKNAASIDNIDFLFSPLIPDVIISKLQLLSNLRYAIKERVEISHESLTVRRPHPINFNNHSLEEVRFKSLLEGMPQVVWTCGIDGTIQYFNKRWIEYMGVCLLPKASESWFNFLHEDERPGIVELWNTAIAEERPFEAELRLKTFKFNKLRWNIVRTEIIPNQEGKPESFFCISTDIEDRIQMESMLQTANKTLTEARDQAIEANHAKSLFIANMSHELLTPLNAIIGFAEIIKEDIPKQFDHIRHDLNSIINAGKHLTNLITDILDIAQIDIGNMDISYDFFVPYDMFQEIHQSMINQAKLQGNRLVLDIAAIKGKTIQSDEIKIRHILVCLLHNACKFTENGTIILQADLEIRPNGEYLVFSVSDTGIGIGEENIPHLYEEFMQADTGNARKFEGTGLGLPLSKKLTNLLSGIISVETKLNNGSKFTVSIPV